MHGFIAKYHIWGNLGVCFISRRILFLCSEYGHLPRDISSVQSYSMVAGNVSDADPGGLFWKRKQWITVDSK